VTQKDEREAEAAREASCTMQEGLDSARRLVERTRFLLAGGAPADDADALALAGEAQAAAPATSDTVQNPSGE
jgi:hypothetical protein